MSTFEKSHHLTHLFRNVTLPTLHRPQKPSYKSQHHGITSSATTAVSRSTEAPRMKRSSMRARVAAHEVAKYRGSNFTFPVSTVVYTRCKIKWKTKSKSLQVSRFPFYFIGLWLNPRVLFSHASRPVFRDRSFSPHPRLFSVTHSRNESRRFVSVKVQEPPSTLTRTILRPVYYFFLLILYVENNISAVRCMSVCGANRKDFRAL